jgi:hypothetical protein
LQILRSESGCCLSVPKNSLMAGWIAPHWPQVFFVGSDIYLVRSSSFENSARASESAARLERQSPVRHLPESSRDYIPNRARTVHRTPGASFCVPGVRLGSIRYIIQAKCLTGMVLGPSNESDKRCGPEVRTFTLSVERFLDPWGL